MRIAVIGLRGMPGVMGGIETHCEQLYPQIVRLDPRIEVIILGRSPYADAGMYQGIRIVPIWAPKQKVLETLLHTPLAILYACLLLKPDVIHLHAIGPAFFIRIAKWFGIKVVATHHAADYERPKWKWAGRTFLKSGEREMALRADRIVCVSQEITRRMAVKYPASARRCVTIVNGAPPTPKVLPPADEILKQFRLQDAPYILGVGRLDAAKGFDNLVDAFKRARLPAGTKLVIAGGAHTTDDYTKALLRHESEHIRFIGVQPREVVSRLYEKASLFVHASHLEGYPLVVLEALMARTPVLLSDIPPHRELGLSRQCYFLDRDVDELAGKLSSADYNRFRCTRVHDIIASTAWPRLAEKHLDLYRAVAT